MQAYRWQAKQLRLLQQQVTKLEEEMRRLHRDDKERAHQQLGHHCERTHSTVIEVQHFHIGSEVSDDSVAQLEELELDMIDTNQQAEKNENEVKQEELVLDMLDKNQQAEVNENEVAQQELELDTLNTNQLTEKNEHEAKHELDMLNKNQQDEVNENEVVKQELELDMFNKNQQAEEHEHEAKHELVWLDKKQQAEKSEHEVKQRELELDMHNKNQLAEKNEHEVKQEALELHMLDMNQQAEKNENEVKQQELELAHCVQCDVVDLLEGSEVLGCDLMEFQGDAFLKAVEDCTATLAVFRRAATLLFFLQELLEDTENPRYVEAYQPDAEELEAYELEACSCYMLDEVAAQLDKAWEHIDMYSEAHDMIEDDCEQHQQLRLL